MAHLLEPFSTCDISDALNKLQKKGQLTDIHLFVGSKIIGPAYTVEFIPVDGVKIANSYVDEVPAGSVIVIKQPALPNAVWGGLMTARAIQRNAKGVVIDGRFRDVQELREFGFHVYAKGKSTMGAGGYCRLKAVQESIEIDGVLIHPGDIVMGDEDGVVCVPAKDVDQVVALCTEAVERDQKIMKELLQGSTLKESFARHR